MKIVIAGAAGFVGQRLIQELKKDYEVIGLRRAPVSLEKKIVDSVEWRQCDLFSLIQTERALEGADFAIYLVHSMLPTAKLTQSNFQDSDLLLADNFARAAKKCGVKRILYLGGIIPEHEELSAHLESRLEVERALESRNVPVTTLRAGLILGANGSSFQILYILVKRLPVMLCPKWVWTITQAIAVDDVVKLIHFCINDERTAGQAYDIGGPDVLSYRDLMAEVAQQLGLKRAFFYVPFFTPGLSRLWIQLITGASRNLIDPLVQSLKHLMIVRNKALLELYGKPLLSLREALQRCLVDVKPTLRKTTQKRASTQEAKNDVRSIQRLPLPAGKDAQWVAREYFRWLPSFLAPLIQVIETTPGSWTFKLSGFKISLLVLTFSPERSTPERQIFYINGGWLAQSQLSKAGRLEFRQTLQGDNILAAIHDFVPRIPWLVYKYSQALVHLWVMKHFGSHLSRVGNRM
jgi:uncharacterized protein YbjT (DUF2867 family)